jgi:hypothetical protein
MKIVAMNFSRKMKSVRAQVCLLDRACYVLDNRGAVAPPIADETQKMLKVPR